MRLRDEPDQEPSNRRPAALAEDLAQLEAIWEGQAASDPLWAILSEPHKRGRKWTLDEFFATGETLVAEWLGRATAAGAVIHHGTAVDFGCGIGRLTQALADRFDAVVGVDISRTMVDIARRMNRHGDRVTYRHNPQSDLSLLADASADLLFTVIVLQHIRPALAESYVDEFFRVVRPGGLVIFHVPSHLEEWYVPAGAIDVPLPVDACHARITLTSDTGIEMEPGEQREIHVVVRNESAFAWSQSQSYPLNVGNRWMDEHGVRILVHDDGRGRLPARLAPGEEARVTLAATAPEAAGWYRLDLDVVQEGVRWFQDLGRPTCGVPVQVRSAGSPTSQAPEPPPRYDIPGLIDSEYVPAKGYEMHGIPKERVLSIIARHGGKLLAVDEYPGPWISYAYYVQKPGG